MSSARLARGLHYQIAAFEGANRLFCTSAWRVLSANPLDDLVDSPVLSAMLETSVPLRRRGISLRVRLVKRSG